MKTLDKTFEDLGFKNKISNELEKNFNENLKDEQEALRCFRRNCAL